MVALSYLDRAQVTVRVLPAVACAPFFLPISWGGGAEGAGGADL
jgi:hypothetical protein